MSRSSTSPKMRYLVKFGSETTYPWCPCVDWRRNRLPCKHFSAIFLPLPQRGWDQLSPLYKENPLFSLDEMCILPASPKEIPSKESSQLETEDIESWESVNACSPPYTSNDEQQLPPSRRNTPTIELARCRIQLKEVLSATYLITIRVALIS